MILKYTLEGEIIEYIGGLDVGIGGKEVLVLSNLLRWERMILGGGNLELDSEVVSFTCLLDVKIRSVRAEDIIVGIICIWMVCENQGLD